MFFPDDSCYENECRKEFFFDRCRSQLRDCLCEWQEVLIPCRVPCRKDDCFIPPPPPCPPPHHHCHKPCPPPAPEPPCHTSCAVVERKPRVLESHLCASMRIPADVCLETVCVNIIDEYRHCRKYIVCFEVKICYIDCCGCRHQCCRTFRNCCDEERCCPFAPCIELIGRPRYEVCGCSVEVKAPIRVVWK